jgi:hypothetical protein
MAKTTRRDVLCAGTSMIAGVASGLVATPQATHAKEHVEKPMHQDAECNFGHTILFMDEYLRGTLEILGRLHGEVERVGELSARAASVTRSGRTVWTSMDSGHMPHYEHQANRRGNPGILKNHSKFDRLQKGDMVFTNDCNRSVLQARKRGVYVVCVAINYQDNEFRPSGFTDTTHSNPDGLMLKDVSNAILHTHVPHQQGLVHAPEIPEFVICPSSGTGSGALFWMLNAEIADKLANKKAKPVKKSITYLDTLTDRVKRIKQQRDRIREVAVSMARRIRDGGCWFMRSIEFKGFESEMTHVASGPMIVNTGDWERSKEKNVLLVNAISPAYKPEVNLAIQKQIEGAYVVGIGPEKLDGVRPAGRLIDIADVGFDNHSPESGGVIAMPEHQGGICPTSGVMGNIIQQMICAQWVDEMVRRGSVPYFFMGSFQEGGSEYNAAMKPFFERQGF